MRRIDVKVKIDAHAISIYLKKSQLYQTTTRELCIHACTSIYCRSTSTALVIYYRNKSNDIEPSYIVSVSLLCSIIVFTLLSVKSLAAFSEKRCALGCDWNPHGDAVGWIYRQGLYASSCHLIPD